MKGRQLLWKIYRHYQLSHAEGSLLSFEDLLGVKMINNDLRAFQRDWDEKMAAFHIFLTGTILFFQNVNLSGNITVAVVVQ